MLPPVKRAVYLLSNSAQSNSAREKGEPLLAAQERGGESGLLHPAQVRFGEPELLDRDAVFVGEVDAADARVVGVEGDGEPALQQRGQRMGMVGRHGARVDVAGRAD